MSEFGKPQACRSSCGMTIYFDKDSTVGHPSPEKWVPLEYVNGIRTDNPHDCPNRRTDGKITATATTTSQEDPNLEGQVLQLMKELISEMELLIKQRSQKQ